MILPRCPGSRQAPIVTCSSHPQPRDCTKVPSPRLSALPLDRLPPGIDTRSRESLKTGCKKTDIYPGGSGG